MPRKITGPSAAGSGKRLLKKAGGTKADLRQWRKLDKPTRQSIKSHAKSWANYDLIGTMGNMREYRLAQRKASK